jgi:hypothetical protein
MTPGLLGFHRFPKPGRMIIFSWGLLALMLTGCIGNPHAADQELSLDNEFLHLTVSANVIHASIWEFVSKSQHRNLASPDSPVPLYQVDLYLGGKAVTLDPSQSDGNFLTKPDSQTLELRSEFKRYGLTVSQTLRLKPGSPTVSISMRFRLKDPGYRIGVARMPGIGLSLDAGPDAAVLLPVADGALLKDPLEHLKNGGKLSYNYPGMASAQLLAAYDRKGGVLCYAADGQGNFKMLNVMRFGKQLVLTFENVLYHLDPPDIAVPYTVELGAFEGGWERAADVYKLWARNQAWCRTPLRDRKLPKELDTTAFSLSLNLREGQNDDKATNRIPEIPSAVKSWSDGLSMPVNAILLSWEKHGPWIAPDYFPPYGGDAGFRGTIESLHKQGQQVTAFLSGYNVTLEKTARHGAPSFRADPPNRKALEAAAIVGRDGQVFRQGRAQEGTGMLSILCPSTPLAKKTVADAFGQLRKFGVDRVQIDQVIGGGTPPCFSTRHGHPPVGGNSMFRSTAGLLDSLAAADPAAVISLEEPGELFIPHVHLFHAREYMEGYWPRDGEGIVGVPLFNYLYHEFSLGYGGDTAPVTQEGEDPAVAIYAQAINLMQGRTPAAGQWMKVIPFDRVNAAQRKFMQAAAALWKGKAGPFLREGEMLALDHQAKMPWRLSARVLGHAIEFNTGKLLYAGYRLPDGRVAVGYVNVTGETLKAEVRFASGRSRIPEMASVLWPAAQNAAKAEANATVPANNPISSRTLKSGESYVFPPYGILFLEASP